jgi:hypothetical protein
MDKAAAAFLIAVLCSSGCGFLVDHQRFGFGAFLGLLAIGWFLQSAARTLQSGERGKVSAHLDA